MDDITVDVAQQAYSNIKCHPSVFKHKIDLSSYKIKKQKKINEILLSFKKKKNPLECRSFFFLFFLCENVEVLVKRTYDV